MGIFDILLLLLGLALFLYGMEVMGDALKRSAGRRLKTILGSLTSNKYKGFLLGFGVTAIIQSSSATTVMVVGFVNSGTMLLSEAIGVIMGANVGTAVTAWITALNGIDSSVGWLNYLKTDFWMPMLALIGISLILFSKKDRRRDVGSILMGFAVLMTGMSLMSDSVAGLKSSPEFVSILTLFTNPILGILAGIILTAIVQSSSASVGILQAISVTGAISYSAAMPIILGQNIGTCVTAMLSSVGANKNGKRAATVHLLFNVIGAILWLILYYGIGLVLRLATSLDIFSLASSNAIDMWGIAAVHTAFKIVSVILIFPFSHLLEKLSLLMIKGEDKKGDKYTAMLDERLLATPDVAISRCRELSAHMAERSISSMKDALTLLCSYDSSKADSIRVKEGEVDVYEDALGSYLVKLSSEELLPSDGRELTRILHAIGDLERISDHAVNLVESGEELKDKQISFSEDAKKELAVITAAVDEILTLTLTAFNTREIDTAMAVEPLEQVIDGLNSKIKSRHISRLKSNLCGIEQGFVLADILTNLERVSDHCSNIAGLVIDSGKDSPLALHSLLARVKNGEGDFTKLYEQFTSKYSL